MELGVLRLIAIFDFEVAEIDAIFFLGVGLAAGRLDNSVCALFTHALTSKELVKLVTEALVVSVENFASD